VPEELLVQKEHPLQCLAQTFLDPKLSGVDKAGQLKKAKKMLADGSEGLELLIEASEVPRVVIAIDQFEEVFTLCRDKDDKDDVVKREQLLSCLLEAAEKSKGKLCLILAMRADFLGKCLEREYSGLGKKIQENLVSVIPMNREQLQEAIALPAKRVNLEVE
jgi:hypothetical protein